jgi:tRNA A37 N6-isopentenylltransferase MiaA
MDLEQRIIMNVMIKEGFHASAILAKRQNHFYKKRMRFGPDDSR